MLVAHESLVPVLLALQLAAFGWRLNREMTVGDNWRKTWLPLPDYLNLLSFFAVVFCCVVIPLADGSLLRAPNATFGRVGSATLSVGYSLIAFHPISEAAHYRLFSKDGRSIYLNAPKGDYPWITDQEVITITLSVIIASIAGCLTWHA